jgi:ActR/RegA family two-component response regulator
MTTPLSGLSILIIEDEYLIADDMERTLVNAGAQVVGPVGSLADVLVLLQDAPHLDFALLDLNLHGQSALAVADKLSEQNVSFAFVTGYDSSEIPVRFHGITRLDKPVETAAVIRLIQGTATRRSNAGL